MIIVFKACPDSEDKQRLKSYLSEHELKISDITGIDREVWCVIGRTYDVDVDILKSFKCVSDVKRIDEPYYLASRSFHPDDTIVTVTSSGGKKISIGGQSLSFIAGPCSIESEEQINLIASHVSKARADILRGGAYKPRSSPYSFQGLRKEGLRLLSEAGRQFNMPTVSELTEISQLDSFSDIDIIQIGARNMQNYELLKELGQINKPVLLKRGLSATITELIMSAEYLINSGNPNVILCERGIRTFETATRNTLDLSCVPILKMKTHLPVIVDPSHATGLEELVAPMSYSATACGAHGIMLEVHDNPEQALCDGQQCISTSQFSKIVSKSKAIRALLSE